ncbi:unnamed protein product, partial [Mesorhabditis belari]|uniref:Uncharacterized protein n=1 Tax=Mesorhabditis belari TaxID=2138241 RepID=A0AAF3EYU6_9BILA
MNGLLTSIIFFITLYSILKNSFNSNRHYQLVQLNILISAQLCDILIAVGEPVVCVPHLTILLLTPLQGPMPVGLAFMSLAAFVTIVLPYTLMIIIIARFPLPETIGGIAPAIAALHSLVNSCIILVTTRFNRRMFQRFKTQVTKQLRQT